MLTGAAKLDAECMPGSVHFFCNPTGGKPAEVIVVPVLQTRLGAGWSGLPRQRAYSWGVGSAGMVDAGTGGKALKRKFCPENYYMVGFARWVCG